VNFHSLSMLPERLEAILDAIVESYVETGQAVGSRAVVERSGLGLSSATVRACMAELMDLGLLAQPHRSAGRVPTERALRSFIEALNEFQEIPSTQKRAIRDRLEEIFESRVRGEETLRSTGQLLSELSGAAAVVAVMMGGFSESVPDSKPWLAPAGLLLAVVFLGRGIAGVLPAVERAAPEQPYLSLNRRIYSPLCALVGASFLFLTLALPNWSTRLSQFFG